MGPETQTAAVPLQAVLLRDYFNKQRREAPQVVEGVPDQAIATGKRPVEVVLV